MKGNNLNLKYPPTNMTFEQLLTTGKNAQNKTCVNYFQLILIYT